MSVVESLSFRDWSGQSRSIRLAPNGRSSPPSHYHVTTVTGTNGSYKSTFLRELVTKLLVPEDNTSVNVLHPQNVATHVVCMSGSVADRFPSKESSGGGSSEYDLPNYSYLGQRVGPNLLSKKRPLETMLTSALDEAKSNRFSLDFYGRAHKLAGVQSSVEYRLEPTRRVRKGGQLDVLDKLHLLARGGRRGKDVPYPRVSRQTAAWILEEFDYDDFLSLQQILESPRRSIRLELSGAGPNLKPSESVAAVRLGLLTDLLTISDVEVRSRSTGTKFSAYDLSSGEYHIFCSLLGLGFCMREESIVLIDEPENSLHPQWQQEFMEAVFAIGSDVLVSGHIIICTHSPLIVAATPDGSTIVDLNFGPEGSDPVSFGASCDEILLSQFGVGSGRNRVVVDAVQKAVSLVERGDFQNPEFLHVKSELESVRKTLSRNDPLVDVIDALLEDPE